jgi:hypothetical protein
LLGRRRRLVADAHHRSVDHGPGRVGDHVDDDRVDDFDALDRVDDFDALDDFDAIDALDDFDAIDFDYVDHYDRAEPHDGASLLIDRLRS